jgi:protoporphyrinogen IX oxidase
VSELIYSSLKAVHVIAVISWMAGLLYLPRLYVYHAAAIPGGEADQTFQIMERKLLNFIMTPAMILAWSAGLALLWQLFQFGILITVYWMHAKIVLVLALTMFHFLLVRWRVDFAAGQNQKSQRFYRFANEVPTLLMMAIVILVIVRPF